jgi:hypothetical protein
LLHFRKKRTCKAIFEDIPINELINNIHTIENEETVHKCEWCEKTYTNIPNLCRHKKNCQYKPRESDSIDETVSNYQLRQNNTPRSDNQPVAPTTNIPPPKSLIEDLQKQIKDLKSMNNRLLEKYRNEAYYQRIIEIFLGNSHEDLIVRGSLMGTTDISTPNLHGEIKTWKKWKYAMGQLIAYNTCNFRPKLNAYMFGRYEDAHKREASKIMKSNGVTVYDIRDTEKGVEIFEYETQESVYSYDGSDEEIL